MLQSLVALFSSKKYGSKMLNSEKPRRTINFAVHKEVFCNNWAVLKTKHNSFVSSLYYLNEKVILHNQIRSYCVYICVCVCVCEYVCS